MAEKLKNLLNEPSVRALAAELVRVFSEFNERGFVADCVAGLEELELTPRAWHIAEGLAKHLPQPFPRAAEVLTRALGPELETTDSFGMAIFRFLPFVFFVQRYGLDDFEAAMRFQYEVTKRFSAESSIRAYLTKYPDETYERLLVWVRDPNPHVRRLVSEGTRPRLPWAPRLPSFQRDPAPVLRLLELLRDDPDRYVQRSVANNLNDIAKDHPQLVIDTCKRWAVGASEGRLWIIGHATRSLVKQGNAAALELAGARHGADVSVGGAEFSPTTAKIGDRVRFSFWVESLSSDAQVLVVDFAVYFVKASGATARKVFKLRKVELGAGDRVELRGSVSMAEHSTRRPYPGRHRVEALVNGAAFGLFEFELLG